MPNPQNSLKDVRNLKTPSLVDKFMKTGNFIYTKLKTNPYEYSTLKFPASIGDSDGLQEYVLININANSSVTEPQLGSGNEEANAGRPRAEDTTARERYAKEQRNKAGTVGATEKSKGGKEIITQGEMGSQSTDKFTNPNRKRLKTAIVLPIPTSAVSATYAADWQAVQLGASGGTLDRFNAAAAAMKADSSKIGEIASAAIGNKEQFAAIVGYSAAPEELKAALEKTGGYALNPRTEVVYKGTPNRTFQFEFKLSPNTPQEAVQIERIIQTLKFAQAPSMTGEFGSWLKYPDDFDISFYFDGKPNPYINKISSCAMTNFTVDYSGGQGGMPTFRDGRPQSVILTMQFTELEIITKERVSQGY